MKHIFYFLLFPVFLLAQNENALHFDGVNDGVNVNASIFSTTSGTQEYTIEAWIKIGNDDDGCIVCQYEYPGANRFQFLALNGKLYWWKGLLNTTNTATATISTSDINDDTWHHVAGTRNSSGTVKIYIDGVLEGTGFDDLPFRNYPTTIGARISNNAGHFTGKIDEIRIWDTALSQSQIQANMNLASCNIPNNLIAKYSFNQGIANGNNPTETILNDDSGNGYDANLLGFSLNGNQSNWTEGVNLNSTGSTSTVSISQCSPYLWEVNGVTYTSSGFYTETLADQSGCDSIINLDLEINSLNTLLTVNQNSISADQANASYQWLNCEEKFAPIIGEIDQTFYTIQTGQFAVEITFDNCVDTSACFTLIWNSTSSLTNNSNLVYPNPSSGTFFIKDDAKNAVVGQIYSTTGQLVQTIDLLGSTSFDVNLPNGIFYLRILDKDRVSLGSSRLNIIGQSRP